MNGNPVQADQVCGFGVWMGRCAAIAAAREPQLFIPTFAGFCPRLPTSNMEGSPTAAEHFEKVGTPVGNKFDDQPAKKRRCSDMAIARTMIGVGILLVTIALFYGVGLPKAINKKIKSGVVTCSASDAAKDSYMDPYGDCHDCTPYYITLYIFNATNAEDHLTNNAKLQVTEVGPYVYRRREIKMDVTVDDDSALVHYKLYTYHTFEQSLSCATCLDTDKITAYDAAYFSVIAAAGGETQFLYSLALGSFGATWNASEIMTAIGTYGVQMMRWVNGLNSLYPSAMKTVSANSAVLSFLTAGPTAIATLDLSGFEYNGLFVTRTVDQWAHGYPSLLAGLALGSNYVNVCESGMNAKCSSCTGSACYEIYNDCKKCTLGAAIMAINDYECGLIESIYASENGATEAASFVATTCKLCSSLGLCAAPLPGWAETSGLDYSITPPNASTLNEYIQHTGCDDDTVIGDYTKYDGYTETALWAELDSVRNPTLSELMAFSSYGNCANKQDNTTCSAVWGNDGASTQPQGANMLGFKSDIKITADNTYLSQGYANLTLYSTDTVVKYDGIKLHRFSPSETLLDLEGFNNNTGIGYPVNGVQSLAFVNGFYAYSSHPLFLWGDESLLEGVQITMSDGVVASKASMYSGGKLLDNYRSAYFTVIDIEAGTGKTMRAHKRLQASYAVAKSVFNTSASMSDVVWPNSLTEVITPVYWGEESATISSSQVSSYKLISNILKAAVPVLIVGLLGGLGLQAMGFLKRRRVLAASKRGSLAAAV